MQVISMAVQCNKMLALLPLIHGFSSRIYSGASAQSKLALELESLMPRDRCEGKESIQVRQREREENAAHGDDIQPPTDSGRLQHGGGPCGSLVW